jgi:uroporphyrinogen-III decarboxylase
MEPRDIILKAFEGGKPERVPVTIFGGGMWSIRDYGSSFEELGKDPAKMAALKRQTGSRATSSMWVQATITFMPHRSVLPLVAA